MTSLKSILVCLAVRSFQVVSPHSIEPTQTQNWHDWVPSSHVLSPSSSAQQSSTGSLFSGTIIVSHTGKTSWNDANTAPTIVYPSPCWQKGITNDCFSDPATETSLLPPQVTADCRSASYESLTGTIEPENIESCSYGTHPSDNCCHATDSDCSQIFPSVVNYLESDYLGLIAENFSQRLLQISNQRFIVETIVLAAQDFLESSDFRSNVSVALMESLGSEQIVSSLNKTLLDILESESFAAIFTGILENNLHDKDLIKSISSGVVLELKSYFEENLSGANCEGSVVNSTSISESVIAALESYFSSQPFQQIVQTTNDAPWWAVTNLVLLVLLMLWALVGSAYVVRLRVKNQNIEKKQFGDGICSSCGQQRLQASE